MWEYGRVVGAEDFVSTIGVQDCRADGHIWVSSGRVGAMADAGEDLGRHEGAWGERVVRTNSWMKMNPGKQKQLEQ